MKCKIGKKTVEYKSAHGASGCLIRSEDNGKVSYALRVYRGREFTDYELFHFDMDIVILAGSGAAFYSDGEKHWLDHDPQTLGYEEVK